MAMLVRRALTAFSAVCLLASGAAAQAGFSYYADFLWRPMTQASCFDRASQSIDAAISSFATGEMTLRQDAWFASARSDDLSLWVYCVADDETENLVNATTGRILVVITVITNRPADYALGIRDFLSECMATGDCAGQAAKPAPTAAAPLKGAGR